MTRQLNKIGFLSLVIIFITSGCSYNIILLSPKDHYGLGNYYLEENKGVKAKEQFEFIRDKYPLSDYTTMSQFKLAQTQFIQEKYDKAILEFELFLEFHPAHKLAPQAQYYLALSKYENMSDPDRDMSMVVDALIEFEQFMTMYPNHPNHEEAGEYIEIIEDHLNLHEYQVGMMYYRRAEYSAAQNRFRKVVNDCHDPELAARASFVIGKCFEKTAEYEEARKYYMIANTKYPDSKWSVKSMKRLKSLPVSQD